MSKTIITDEQIAAINALAIGESLTLTDGRTVTCEVFRGDTACGPCICEDNDDLDCDLFACGPYDRNDGASVIFAVSEEA